MLQPKNFCSHKTIVVAVLAVSLAACSPSPESTNSPASQASPDSQGTNSPATSSSSSPQQTDLSANISIPESITKDINFKAATNNSPMVIST